MTTTLPPDLAELAVAVSNAGENLTPSPVHALALRRLAAHLLYQAQKMDHLKPYIVTYGSGNGTDQDMTSYLTFHTQIPTVGEAARLIECHNYGEGPDDRLDIGPALEVWAVTGSMPAAILDEFSCSKHEEAVALGYKDVADMARGEAESKAQKDAFQEAKAYQGTPDAIARIEAFARRTGSEPKLCAWVEPLPKFTTTPVDEGPGI